jgi:hypothetical protein
MFHGTRQPESAAAHVPGRQWRQGKRRFGDAALNSKIPALVFSKMPALVFSELFALPQDLRSHSTMPWGNGRIGSRVGV